MKLVYKILRFCTAIWRTGVHAAGSREEAACDKISYEVPVINNRLPASTRFSGFRKYNLDAPFAKA